MSCLLEKQLSSSFGDCGRMWKNCVLRKPHFCDLSKTTTVIPALWVLADLFSVKQGLCKASGVVLVISQCFSECCLSSSNAGWHLSRHVQHSALPTPPSSPPHASGALHPPPELCRATALSPEGQHLLLYSHNHPLPLPAYKRNLPTVSLPSFLTIQLCVCQVVWDRRVSDGMAWMLGTCLMAGSCFGSAQCLVCNAKSHPNRDSSWAFRGAGKFSNILCSPSPR